MAYQNPYSQAAANQNKKKKKPTVNPTSMYNPQARPQLPASQAVGTDPITQAMMPDASTMYNAAAQPAVDPTSMFNPQAPQQPAVNPASMTNAPLPPPPPPPPPA